MLDCMVCGKAQRSAFLPHTASNAGALKPIWRSALWVLVTALSCDGRHGGKARY